MTPDLMYHFGSNVLVPSAQTTAETVQTAPSVAVQPRSLRPVIRTDFIWISQDHNRLFQD